MRTAKTLENLELIRLRHNDFVTSLPLPMVLLHLHLRGSSRIGDTCVGSSVGARIFICFSDPLTSGPLP